MHVCVCHSLELVSCAAEDSHGNASCSNVNHTADPKPTAMSELDVTAATTTVTSTPTSIGGIKREEIVKELSTRGQRT